MIFNQSLEGKKVKILDVDGEEYEGIVSEYIYPEDNDPEGIAAIDLENCPQYPGKLIGFNENEIKTIRVLK